MSWSHVLQQLYIFKDVILLNIYLYALFEAYFHTIKTEQAKKCQLGCSITMNIYVNIPISNRTNKIPENNTLSMNTWAVFIYISAHVYNQKYI